MEFTDQEKIELIKKILIARIEEADSLETMKTWIGSTAWTKLMSLLDLYLQTEADQCNADSHEALDRKGKVLALKEEKDSF